MEQRKQNPESSGDASQVIQEFIVRTPKDKNKHFNVMTFNKSLNVDVMKWKQVKMERENNLKEFKVDDDSPKFGAGSEYGREQKEEARRKKLGIITKQYKSEDQPWILNVNEENNSKKFKGVRQGGVTENSDYYIFTQAADGAFEAYAVSEWYNFTPTQCFKPLSVEEAEEEFERRDKVYNYFTIMSKKRCQGESYEEEDDEEKKQKNRKKKKEKDFKITDFDEWGNTHDSDEMDDDDEDREDDEKPSKKQSGKGNKKKKKKEDADKSDDEEPGEESDEGDFDDKEVDYITSSSSSEEEELGEDEKVNRDLRGVEDEEALKMMEEQEDEEEEQEKEQEPAAEAPKEKPNEPKAKKKPSKSDSSGESSSESSDSDLDDQKFNSAIFVQQNQKMKKKSGSDSGSTASSRAETPTKMQADKDAQRGTKRKLPDNLVAHTAKKTKAETSQPSTSGGGLDSINEELLRRYLQRKPMTASELLQKVKSKKKNLTSEQLVAKIADVLKKMDLQKHKVKNKMYLSLK